MRHIAWGHANTALVERFCQATIPKQFHFISFSEEFRGSGKVWCLSKESTSQVLSELNPESGELANKLVNKLDLLGRLISAVQCILCIKVNIRQIQVNEHLIEIERSEKNFINDSKYEF